MKIANKKIFYSGLGILIFLLISYFIRFEVDSGSNYIVEDTLLGILIFHSLFIFIIYILIGAFFVFIGIKGIKII